MTQTLCISGLLPSLVPVTLKYWQCSFELVVLFHTFLPLDMLVPLLGISFLPLWPAWTTFDVPISNLVVTSSLKTVFPPYSLPPSSCLCTLYALNFIYHSTALIICLYGSYQNMRTGYKIFISVYPAYSLNTNGTPDSVC